MDGRRHRRTAKTSKAAAPPPVDDGSAEESSDDADDDKAKVRTNPVPESRSPRPLDRHIGGLAAGGAVGVLRPVRQVALPRRARRLEAPREAQVVLLDEPRPDAQLVRGARGRLRQAVGQDDGQGSPHAGVAPPLGTSDLGGASVPRRVSFRSSVCVASTTPRPGSRGSSSGRVPPSKRRPSNTTGVCWTRGDDRVRTPGNKKRTATEAEWIQCNNPNCGKWRAISTSLDGRAFEQREEWYCVMNTWDETLASCSAPQEIPER